MSASPPTLDKLPRQKLPRRRDAARRWMREQRIRADRVQTLKDPDRADLTPAAVSVIEFRRLTGLSHATVHRRIKDGTLKSCKIAGRRLIAWAEIARLRAGEP